MDRNRIIAKLLFIAIWLFLASPSFAADLNFLGTYIQQSGVKSAATEESCSAEKGDFSGEPEWCFVANENTQSSIQVQKNSDGNIIVHIETIYGNYNMRSFDGVVTRLDLRSIRAREVELKDNGQISRRIKNGCALTIGFSHDGKASTILGPECDPGLTITDAVKTR